VERERCVEIAEGRTEVDPAGNRFHQRARVDRRLEQRELPRHALMFVQWRIL
jgi:hypothetical protein